MTGSTHRIRLIGIEWARSVLSSRVAPRPREKPEASRGDVSLEDGGDRDPLR